MTFGDNIVVIGVGVGGLTLAVALSRAGFRCHVFERNRTYSPPAPAVQALVLLGLDRLVAGAGEEVRSGLVKSADGATFSVRQETSSAIVTDGRGHFVTGPSQHFLPIS